MKKLNCYYFNEYRNFGDLLNEKLFDKLFGSTWRSSENILNADILGIGSVLQGNRTRLFYKTFFRAKKSPIVLLGTGISRKKPFLPEYFLHNVIPIGIRGELTKKRLEKLGFDCSKTILGDWGLILDTFCDVNMDNIKKEYDIGIIPHYTDKNNIFNEKMISLDKKIKIIDVGDTLESFISELLKCKTIMASAMHGLIAADCFGIPNIAIKIDDIRIGGSPYSYKFDDYYTTFNEKFRLHSKDTVLREPDLVNYIKHNNLISYDKIQANKLELNKCFKKVKSVYESKGIGGLYNFL